MVLPISDDNEPYRTRQPTVTWALVALTAVVFVLQVVYRNPLTESLVFYPEQLFNPGWAPPINPDIPAELRLVTHIFVHGGPLHIGANMLMLWIFGDNVEDAMGHAKFAIFYIVCGVFAGLCHGFFEPDPTLSLGGASGAIYGVAAAYLLLHPKARVTVFVLYRTRAFPAWLVIGFYILGDAIAVLADPANMAAQGGPQVAHFAHLGGALAGALLIPFARDEGVPLFHDEATYIDGPRPGQTQPDGRPGPDPLSERDVRQGVVGAPTAVTQTPKAQPRRRRAADTPPPLPDNGIRRGDVDARMARRASDPLDGASPDRRSENDTIEEDTGLSTAQQVAAVAAILMILALALVAASL